MTLASEQRWAGSQRAAAVLGLGASCAHGADELRLRRPRPGQRATGANTTAVGNAAGNAPGAGNDGNSFFGSVAGAGVNGSQNSAFGVSAGQLVAGSAKGPSINN